MKRSFGGLCLVFTGMLVLAACSSSGSSKSSGSTTTKAKSSKPTATAEPTTGLTNGATVTIKVKGFTAGKTLGINECADTPGTTAGQDDCDLSGIKTLTVGSDGTGTGATPVKSSGIGKNQHNCMTPPTRCFLSVGELTADPSSQRADDVNLTFVG